MKARHIRTLLLALGAAGWLLALPGPLQAANFRTVYFGGMVEHGQYVYNANEDRMLYNAARWTSMRTAGIPIKVTVLHSIGSDSAWYSYMWQPFDSRYADITVNAYTTRPYTYDALVQNAADVLVISNAWHGPPDQVVPPNPGGADWSYTPAEVDAIGRYLQRGHGLIITAGSFGQFSRNTATGANNYDFHQFMCIESTGGGNSLYADTFPWSRGTGSPYPVRRDITTTNIDAPAHPIAAGLPPSFSVSSGSLYVGTVSQWMAADGATQVAHFSDASGRHYADSLVLACETIDVNQPPVANAGGPYVEECNGTPTRVQLDGTGSWDPDGDVLLYQWTTTCPQGTFDLATIATPVVSMSPPPPCPVVCDVTLAVDDGRGYIDSETTSVTVEDTTPPVVQEGNTNLYFPWSPNHKYEHYDKQDFRPVIDDACNDAPVTWRFAGCDSNQPDNDVGDGDTEMDCILDWDGRGFVIRSERQGTDPAGRSYAVSITATDGCGNTSAPVVIGYVHVVHDEDAK